MSRLTGFCLLIVIVGVAAAFWFHWINVSTTGNPDDSKRGVTVTLDKDKVKEDVNAAKQAVKKAEERVKNEVSHWSGSATMTGVVSRVEPDQNRITVTNDKDTVDLQVNDQTTIRVGGKVAHLADLHVGEKATVSYATKDKDHLAESITVVAGG
jgi:ABC-type lipoprotein release transport system permease subunit